MSEQSDTDILREIRRLLQYHHSLGIREYPRTQGLERFLRKEDRPASSQASGRSSSKKKTTPATLDQKHIFDPALAVKVTLQDVRNEIGDCQRCPLHETRTKIVFGQGPETAKLMIIADAPDERDDREGTPCQGNAGDLLDKMLSAISLTRDEVYITTLVKCFPGPGASPGDKEIKTCLPFLFRQIEIICPTVICAMGSQVSQTLLHSRKSLFQLRGRFYNFNDLCSSKLADRIMLMPSLHPSLLLKNPELKKASWQDLQLIQKKLEE
jgi:uracil-DNA glycosylase family 4